MGYIYPISLDAMSSGIYRDGFRVLPYGEAKNDWLGLDEEYRKRSTLYPLANINWFGFVQIDDPEGVKFEETSSREGLANNPPYQELVSFVSSTLIAAAGRVASRRDRKLSAGQKNFLRKPELPTIQLLSEIADNLDQAAENIEKSTGARGIGRESATAFRHAAENVRRAAAQSEALIQEIAMLRVLSSLGLMIGIFTHEIRHQLFNLRNMIRDWFEKHGSDSTIAKVLPVLESRLSLLRSYTAYFDSAISAVVRRELGPQNLSKILFNFIDQFTPIVERGGAKIDGEDIEEDLVTRPMHISEWTSILGNLLTNSLKAIKRGSHTGKGRISIQAWQEDRKIFVEFSDNGDGIPPENRERIFEPFFTTTSSTLGKEDDLTGMGLGLKIVRDIVSSARGDVQVTTPPKGYSTCIRIEIPAAQEVNAK